MALVSRIGSARTGSPASTWWLSHPWDSPSDLAALSLCRMAMRPWGIELVDGSVIAGESPGIVKMHGMEMVESTQPLFDLRQVALAQQWAQRLPTWIRRYMQRGESWHGIPMGIHQANVAWVNADCVQALGGIWPNTFSSWLRWLEHLRSKIRYPLALGGQLWQIGVLFESVVLSVAGPDLYRRAFVELQPSVWCPWHIPTRGRG